MSHHIDNAVHRALFSLPPIKISLSADVSVPKLPPQRIVTGDREVDAVIWLREVVSTGQPALIEKAKKAAAKIKTPLKELEKRYSAYLARVNGGHLFATLGAMGFADLDEWENTSLKMAARRHEARARFGDSLFENTAAESFAEAALAGVEAGIDEYGIDDMNKVEVDARFDAAPDQRPATLADCLAELKFWIDLYWLRNAIDRDAMEFSPQAQARKDYAFRSLARIPPRSTEEARQVLQFLYDDDAMNWEESPGILRNLMTQQAGQNTAGDTGAIEKCRSAAAAIHGSGPDLSDMPEMQQLRAALLKPVPPVTARDIVEVLEQLDALATAGGQKNVCEFAIDVINGLMLIVDVEKIA